MKRRNFMKRISALILILVLAFSANACYITVNTPSDSADESKVASTADSSNDASADTSSEASADASDDTSKPEDENQELIDAFKHYMDAYANGEIRALDACSAISIDVLANALIQKTMEKHGLTEEKYCQELYKANSSLTGLKDAKTANDAIDAVAAYFKETAENRKMTYTYTDIAIAELTNSDVDDLLDDAEESYGKVEYDVKGALRAVIGSGTVYKITATQNATNQNGETTSGVGRLCFVKKDGKWIALNHEALYSFARIFYRESIAGGGDHGGGTDSTDLNDILSAIAMTYATASLRLDFDSADSVSLTSMAAVTELQLEAQAKAQSMTLAQYYEAMEKGFQVMGFPDCSIKSTEDYLAFLYDINKEVYSTIEISNSEIQMPVSLTSDELNTLFADTVSTYRELGADITKLVDLDSIKQVYKLSVKIDFTSEDVEDFQEGDVYIGYVGGEWKVLNFIDEASA